MRQKKNGARLQLLLECPIANVPRCGLTATGAANIHDSRKKRKAQRLTHLLTVPLPEWGCSLQSVVNMNGT